MKTLKQINRLLLLLCLIVAGAQNAWAENQYVYAGTRTEGNLRFDIYHQYYYVNFLFAVSNGDIAVLKGITGTAEEVTIPANLVEPGEMFGIPVRYANGTISNSYVKTLTFAGSISFIESLKGYVNQQAPNVEIEGHLNCPNLKTIIFKGNGDGNGLYTYETETTTPVTLQCPNLTDIYFQNSYAAPQFESKIVFDFSGSTLSSYTIPVTWEQICTAPASNVTAYVAAWTQEECDQRHQSANVYKQLKDVVHYKEGENLVTVTASVSDGAIFQAEDYGELSGYMIKSKDIDKSSNLTFYVYPSSDDIVIDHVYVNDTDVKNQMTTTSDGKKQYTLEGEVMQDDVVIRVVGARKVKITVSVEEAGAGNGVMFKYNNSEYIYGRGTKTYTKVMHIDYTFYVADGNKATIKNVFVNGEDVYQDMVEVTDSENPFYDASNVRKYTIENVNSDITIRITSEETVDHYTLYVGSGGKIEFDFDNAHQSCANNNYCQFAFNKSQTLTVTATPDEGYEFESFLFEGTKLDTDMGEWITMETQADGKFVVNLALGTYQMPYTDNSYVVAFTFKKASRTTWTVLQSGEMTGAQVVITRNGEDEETTLANAINTMEINDVGVEKVTLKVPIGNAVPVTKYQIRVESIANETITQLAQYISTKCGMSKTQALEFLNNLPGLIPKQFDSEADAQPIVERITATGGVAMIVLVTAGTQAIANNTPIRVAHNGEEVTFQADFSDPLYAVYEVPANALTNSTWEVSYDANHRQTILRSGASCAVEVGYKYIGEEAITRSVDMGLTTIDLPSFNSQYSNFVEFAIEAIEGKDIKVYRNGSDVTDVFGEPQSLQGKNWYYISSYSYDTQIEFGFQLREPATWDIKIEESHKMLNAYANNNVVVSLAKVVDGEEPNFVAHNNSMHQWVNKGETYIIKFTPMNGEELIRFDIGWNAIDIQQESRLVKNDDGSYSFTLTYNDIPATQGNFDMLAVFEVGSAGTSYDLNNDGQVNITDVIVLVNRILGNN